MLNDELRRDFSKGHVLITEAVTALGIDAVNQLLVQVASYDDFTPENDPYGEHDFGSFRFSGQLVFWKIDYYDLDLNMHSPDPANPAVTERVLTIMLASEY